MSIVEVLCMILAAIFAILALITISFCFYKYMCWMKDFGECMYICADCAHKKGGKWPGGHCATFNEWHCDCCEKKTSVCNVRNWNWPRRDYDSIDTNTTSAEI